MKIVIMGPPGSGKGTMAGMLHEHLQVPHISTGDLFRVQVKNGTELGIQVREYLAQGDLVPDELTTKMVHNRLLEEDAENGFILDGFPRNKQQAELFEQEVIVEKVVFLEVKDKTVMQRITNRRTCEKCGMMYHLINVPPKQEGICDVCKGNLVHRDDEKEETIKHRLDVYHKETEPVKEFYVQRNVLVTVDAEESPDKVFESIVSQIGRK